MMILLDFPWHTDYVYEEFCAIEVIWTNNINSTGPGEVGWLYEFMKLMSPLYNL